MSIKQSPEFGAKATALDALFLPLPTAYAVDTSMEQPASVSLYLALLALFDGARSHERPVRVLDQTVEPIAIGRTREESIAPAGGRCFVFPIRTSP